jgi:hypothetical protein
VLIICLWQLKTVVFLYRCLIRAILLKPFFQDCTISFKTLTKLDNTSRNSFINRNFKLLYFKKPGNGVGGSKGWFPELAGTVKSRSISREWLNKIPLYCLEILGMLEKAFTTSFSSWKCYKSHFVLSDDAAK